MIKSIWPIKQKPFQTVSKTLYLINRRKIIIHELANDS